MLTFEMRALLDFAIDGEMAAYNLYSDLAQKSSHPEMRKVFEGFAQEELGHKAKLEGIKSGKASLSLDKKIADLKISDYIVEVKADPNMNYQQALLFAMQKEKAAFKLYYDLANNLSDAHLRNIFLALAHEEAKHKLRFEIEYDQKILTEG